MEGRTKINNKNILGKYNVLNIIGRGGNSVVYLAEHRVLGQRRVIKAIAKDNPHCESYLKEVKFLKTFKYAAIPVLYDYEEDESNYYIIQEYIEGISLKECYLIHRDKSIEITLKNFIELTEIFIYLHEHKPYPVVYLDLKPEHIIISKNRVRLLDFGAALELKGANIIGECMGTYGFAAPELVEGKTIDIRTDIYSIGAVMFWCLVNETADKLSETDIYYKLSNYSKNLQNIIAKCLEYNPDKRFQSMKELCRELKALSKDCLKVKTSYRIAVIGCLPRIGVTHFCLELVYFLNKNNIKSLYKERTDNSVLTSLCEESKSFYEKQGIVYGENFYGMPKYGQAVIIDDNEWEFEVLDYGCLFNKINTEIKKADLCVAIVGTKSWERNMTKQLFYKIQQLKNIIKVIYIAPQQKYVIGRKKVISFPYNKNPFKLDNESIKFFNNILGNIQQFNCKREAFNAKNKRNRMFAAHNRNTRN